MPGVAVSSRMVEGLPLADPVRTDARAEGFHLHMEGLEFVLEEFSALVELELRKTLGQDSLNLLMGMGFQEIQDHRVTDRKLAVDSFRLPGQPFGQNRQINIRRGSHNRKSDVVFPAAAGSSGDLLDFADGQVGEVAGLADAGLRDHDRAGWKIDTRRQGCRSEDRIEMALSHQLFDRDFPRRQMPGMMGGDADSLYDGNEGMFDNARILRDNPFERRTDRLLSHRRKYEIGMIERLHRFVTGSP